MLILPAVSSSWIVFHRDAIYLSNIWSVDLVDCNYLTCDRSMERCKEGIAGGISDRYSTEPSRFFPSESFLPASDSETSRRFASLGELSAVDDANNLELYDDLTPARTIQ